MEEKLLPRVSFTTVGDEEAGQRIDNYLFRILKGVPRTRIYKAIRSGEVRVNGSRVKVSYRIEREDRIRIPPVRVSAHSRKITPSPDWLNRIPVLFEDPHLLIVDKPSGLAVHGGTGMPFGLIEGLRHLRTELAYLELVHRLDRETSGCLMLAKTRESLLHLQNQLGGKRSILKLYLALVKGSWGGVEHVIDLKLARVDAAGEEKRMGASENGKEARSIVWPVDRLKEATQVEMELLTGRTHQARVHCAESGYPIAGDRIYGDRAFNATMGRLGLKRLFLHAYRLTLVHPGTGRVLSVEAPVPPPLLRVLQALSP